MVSLVISERWLVVSLVVSVVDFGTVGYNETETDNTAAFSLRAASQPVAAAGGGEAPSGEGCCLGPLGAPGTCAAPS